MLIFTMASSASQNVLEHAHSLITEYCVLSSKWNIMNGISYPRPLCNSHRDSVFYCLCSVILALTRDLQNNQKNTANNNTNKNRTSLSSTDSSFHSNIKRFSTIPHQQYTQKVHIVHFSQFQWTVSLPDRPDTMLPTAHHLITFFNFINIEHVDISRTQSLRDEFIVQCLLSMDPLDTEKWTDLLSRYCRPFEFCPIYEPLRALSGQSNRSQSVQTFKSQHSWNCFTENARKWCQDVIQRLDLKPEHSILHQIGSRSLTDSIADSQRESPSIPSVTLDDLNGINLNRIVVDITADDEDDDVVPEEVACSPQHGGGRYVNRENAESEEHKGNELDSLISLETNHETDAIDSMDIGEDDGGNTQNAPNSERKSPEPDLELALMSSSGMMSTVSQEQNGDVTTDLSANQSHKICIDLDVEEDHKMEAEEAVECLSMGPSSMPSLEMGTQDMDEVPGAVLDGDDEEMDEIDTTQEDDFEADSEPQKIGEIRNGTVDRNVDILSEPNHLTVESLDNLSGPDGVVTSQLSEDSTPSQILSQCPPSESAHSQNGGMTQNQRSIHCEDDISSFPMDPLHEVNGINGLNPLHDDGRDHILSPSDLIPRDNALSPHNELLPESVMPSQMPIEMDRYHTFTVDHLSQNKPPSTSRQYGREQEEAPSMSPRGTKRNYHQMSGAKGKAEQSVQRKKARNDGGGGGHHRADSAAFIEEKKPKMGRSGWCKPQWMKRGAKVTVEKDDDILCAVIVKVTGNWIMIKVTDDSAPLQYRDCQFRIFEKDRNKVLRFLDFDENSKQKMDGNHLEFEGMNGKKHDDDDDGVGVGEDDGANVESDEMTEQLVSVLKPSRKGRDIERTHSKHIRWQLTMSQEEVVSEQERRQQSKGTAMRPALRRISQRRNCHVDSQHDDRCDSDSNGKRSSAQHSNSHSASKADSLRRDRFERMFGDIDSSHPDDDGVEMEWSDNDDDDDGDSIFDSYRSGQTVTSKLPDRITNEELMADPFAFCGLDAVRRSNKLVKGSGLKGKHRKTAWTEEETMAVIEGYRKYKEYANPAKGENGIWHYIAKDFTLGKVLVNRKNRQIRDKWMHLLEKKDYRVREFIDDDDDDHPVQPDNDDKRSNPITSPLRKKMPKLATRPVP